MTVEITTIPDEAIKNSRAKINTNFDNVKTSVDLNDTHRTSDGKNHSDVVLNNAHRTSDGKNHSDVVLNNAHRVATDNPHEVSAAQVGNDTAQWNANKIDDIPVDATGISTTQYLAYNGTTEQFEPANPGTPAAHKTSHEDGGADEISIEGLAGTPAELTTHMSETTTHGANGNIVGDTDLSNEIGTLLEAIYPVGSIFVSGSATMPALISSLGTWARIQGRVIVGASDTDGDFDNGDTGGAKTHTLTEAELASHTHGQQINNGGDGAGGDFVKASVQQLAVVAFSGVDTQSTGSGTAHNNLQPYKAKFMWERVS